MLTVFMTNRQAIEYKHEKLKAVDTAIGKTHEMLKTLHDIDTRISTALLVKQKPLTFM